jgi:hypothetical protein
MGTTPKKDDSHGEEGKFARFAKSAKRPLQVPMDGRVPDKRPWQWIATPGAGERPCSLTAPPSSAIAPRQ